MADPYECLTSHAYVKALMEQLCIRLHRSVFREMVPRAVPRISSSDSSPDNARLAGDCIAPAVTVSIHSFSQLDALLPLLAPSGVCASPSRPLAAGLRRGDR